MRTPNPAISPSPRRLCLKRRGAFFGLCAALGALLLVVSGRMFSGFERLFAPQPAPIQNPARQAKRDNSLNGSLGAALAKIDANTVRKYLERWSNPEKSARPTGRRAVFIDSEALARRHPAWRLAAELERGTVSPQSPPIAQVLAPRRLPRVTENTFSTRFGAEATLRRALPGVILQDTQSEEVSGTAQTAQSLALTRFLAKYAAQAANRARDEAFLSRRALEDAVALARRGAVSEAHLPLLDSETALELLNLRLELLRNLARTPTQRAASREQIRAIEARYAAILRQQTELQARRLREATIEIPDRALAEGNRQIERETLSQAQKTARDRLDLTQFSLQQRRGDIAAGGALQLALPPIPGRPFSPFNRQETDSNPVTPALQADFFETVAAKSTSEAPLEGRTAPAQTALGAGLRDVARRDARVWSERAAAQFGAVLNRRPDSNVPDMTARALRFLFPAAWIR